MLNGIGAMMAMKEEQRPPEEEGKKLTSSQSQSQSQPQGSDHDDDIENPTLMKFSAANGGGNINGTPTNNGDGDSGDTDSVTSWHGMHNKSTSIIVLMILILGTATCAAFLGVGIGSAKRDETDQFRRRAQDLVNQIQRAWEDYEVAASWIHGRCRGRNFTRHDFRQMYEYLIGSGLEFQAAQFDPNITHEERPAAEAEIRAWLDTNYPGTDYTYRGFVGFNNASSTSLEPRHNASFYFPIHYMEPIIGNQPAIDLDYHASGSRKDTVMFCMNEGKPALTDRLRLVQETTASAYGVVLMHPGFNVSDSEGEVWPRDLASIVIRIPDLIRRAAASQGESSAVYIFNKRKTTGDTLFLGAAKIEANRGGENEATLTFLPELELNELLSLEDVLLHEDRVAAANKEWIVVVHSLEGTYKPDVIFVILGGVIIFVSAGCLACWVRNNTLRVDQFNQMKAASDQEKASLILENARKATRAERDLNDFIAHEVRNPVAAAMSACSFVKTAIGKPEPLKTTAQREETREDVEIIDNALRFVNDLLRNMLDMHRAANKQLKVNMTPTDILHDVLEPVQAMLPQRDSKFKVYVECDRTLVTLTDRLRLKQICLNLARNSVKFIDEGFIRMKGEVRDNEVYIVIEDSGPGIPKEKREMLFAKFQESLDSLSQGTGIGLFLCKNLVALMNGEILLDENYDSGIKGYPGTRFIVNLKQPPIDPHSVHEYHHSHSATNGTGETAAMDSDGDESAPKDLPENLSVLFVDDDPILRKLFNRTVRTVAPGWKIREAANGETALRLVESESFDLIFMDMYMASVEKQLLGTETVEALRSKGITCRICGLSANDKESEFLEAGANVFTFKPFPCEAKALTNELCRVLFRDDKGAEQG